jgi:hypothetical protein
MPSCSKTSSQLGGALINDIADLAVPFGLILAQRGLSYVLQKQKESKPVKASVRGKKTSQTGGVCESCLLCNSKNSSLKGQGGGVKNDLSRSTIQDEYRHLADELRGLLVNSST